MSEGEKQNEQKTFQDLSGDPVYDHCVARSKVSPGWSIVGGQIIELAIAGPKQPRKCLRLLLQDQKGKQHAFDFNYNKIKREMRR
jgi:hypothetical protein